MNSTNTENQNMESDETAAVVQPTTMSVLSSEDSNGVFGLKKAPKRHYTKRKERKVVYSLDKPPRKKAKKRNLKIPDWNELSALFHLSSSEAAKKLNISISKLYEVIKLYNMSGWPTKKTPCRSSKSKSFNELPAENLSEYAQTPEPSYMETPCEELDQMMCEPSTPWTPSSATSKTNDNSMDFVFDKLNMGFNPKGTQQDYQQQELYMNPGIGKMSQPKNNNVDFYNYKGSQQPDFQAKPQQNFNMKGSQSQFSNTQDATFNQRKGSQQCEPMFNKGSQQASSMQDIIQAYHAQTMPQQLQSPQMNVPRKGMEEIEQFDFKGSQFSQQQQQQKQQMLMPQEELRLKPQQMQATFEFDLPAKGNLDQFTFEDFPAQSQILIPQQAPIVAQMKQSQNVTQPSYSNNFNAGLLNQSQTQQRPSPRMEPQVPPQMMYNKGFNLQPQAPQQQQFKNYVQQKDLYCPETFQRRASSFEAMSPPQQKLPSFSELFSCYGSTTNTDRGVGSTKGPSL